MQITVFGPLRSAAGGKTADVAPSGETVRDLLDAFVARYPNAETHLCDDEGDVRPSVRVMIGDRPVSLDDAVPDGETVKLFPAMRGG
ncbi:MULTISPECIES: ubiquitin-like small modifier protein 1 [Haloferax]|uniref:ThiS family protein n=1 Tax=Haloferax massiliensis TaxID=1476858 RepID=A0A0D6JUH4_9EURY|nr:MULTISPECIES: ubiquitin-like small modifier protein 1 [Haloferax]MDS0241735.1 MoaD/ThiS family protein [Haloferax sp. S2CR25]MDS0444856.1 MoaD/ThiS family protein [Haloferax sp. S2CR25-2]CQR52178.1 ThiS family protein [Haloferax massiliensis]